MMNTNYAKQRIQWWLQYRCDMSLKASDRKLARIQIRKWIAAARNGKAFV